MSEMAIRVIAEEDWANAWKEHFHPLRIGRQFVVKPTWREFHAKPGDMIIELDPGMAFGTGIHPTTRMMLEAMETVPIEGRSVLDIGTGSGILAIGAVKLGAHAVLAVDVDATSCDVAHENAQLNSAEDRISVRLGTVEEGDPVCDVVLVNIIATVIAGLAPTLARVLAQNGVLVASGIIEERVGLVEEAFLRGLAFGFVILGAQMTGYVWSLTRHPPMPDLRHQFRFFVAPERIAGSTVTLPASHLAADEPRFAAQPWHAGSS